MRTLADAHEKVLEKKKKKKENMDEKKLRKKVGFSRLSLGVCLSYLWSQFEIFNICCSLYSISIIDIV